MNELSENKVLEVKNLSVNFQTSQRKVEAVKNLSFYVDKGETLAIVGESGSGKSVTSLTLMRLVKQGGGKITQGNILFRRRKKQKNQEILDLTLVNNKIIQDIRGSDIAMIFQEPMTSLNPVFTVGNQISESIILHQNKDKKSALAESLRMLELVRIPEAKTVLKRFPHQLSGGMRQRVMIAMALACKPNLLIADEPTTALDVTIQAQILQLIRQLQEEMQMGVVFITHDMGVVAEVADRILVMYKGEKVEEGISKQIFLNPNHDYTKALLSAVPRLGSMTGKKNPAKFDLLNLKEKNQDNQKEQNLENQIEGLNREKPILSVKNLTTRFDIFSGIFNRVKKRVHAVENINFDLYLGETLALVGESGCGKSTTGRTLLRLIENQKGEIFFDGQDITKLKNKDLQNVRKNIQCIFQDPYASLDPRITIGFSIMEPLLIHKIIQNKKEGEKIVAELLERVGLESGMAHRYPHEFSGGQRQRICIARAIALKPKVIIADESVSALDVSIQAQIINLLMDLQKDLKISLLFISHDMAVVERISHRVAVMYLGQIVEIGSRQAIFENPIHSYTKKLMSAVPIVDPSRRTLKRTLLIDEIPSPIFDVNYEPIINPLIKIADNHFVIQN